MSKQIVMVSLDDLVSGEHIYRKFCGIWKFEFAKKQLRDVEKYNNYKGYGIAFVQMPIVAIFRGFKR